MVQACSYFEDLKSAYIFPVIEKKVAQLEKEHPNQKVLNLGIGDVGLPLAPLIAGAIQEAVKEMAERPIGYGPGEGLSFLRKTIHEHEYARFGIEEDEIFISSGAGPDCATILGLFDPNAVVAMADPTYPAYRDATIMSGRKIHYIPVTETDHFCMRPQKEAVDLVYICTPSNPTGVALTQTHLEEWVAWAKHHKAILLIDNVYNCFVTSDDVPDSIYAVEGADEVAIEMRSFSKSAGFTGLRCGYSVVPKRLHLPMLHDNWNRMVNILTNGVAYPIQKGAQACYTDEGKQQLKEQIAVYQASAKRLRSALENAGQIVYGGVNSPYLFLKGANGETSWELFDELLERARLVTVPGSGFGPCGEGFVRLSSFISETVANEAADALHHFFTTG